MRLPDGNFVLMRISEMFILGEIYAHNIYINVESTKYDTIVDVGANIGLFSLKLSKLNPKANVFSIEPDPDNFKLLKINSEKNSSEIKIFNMATSYKSGTANFFVSPITVASSLYKTPGSKRITVKIDTLDNILQNEKLTNVLLKIDVEGAEIEVLKGAENVLSKSSAVIIEVHPFRFKRVNSHEVTKFLMSRGFIISSEKITSTEILITAKKT